MIKSYPHCLHCGNLNIDRLIEELCNYPDPELFKCTKCSLISNIQEYTNTSNESYYWDNNSSSDWIEMLTINNYQFLKFLKEYNEDPIDFIEVQLFFKLH